MGRVLTPEEFDAMAGGASAPASAPTPGKRVLTPEQFDRVASGVSELRPAPTEEPPKPISTLMTREGDRLRQAAGPGVSAASTAASTVYGFAELLPFATQLPAALGTIADLGLQAGSLDPTPDSIGDIYRANRGELERRAAANQAAAPTAFRVGQLGSVGAQVAAGGGLKIAQQIPGAVRTAVTNPRAALSAAATPLRALQAALSNPGAAVRGAALPAAKGAGSGAGYGVLQGVSGSEGDLTQGEFGQVGVDALSQALVSSILGGILGGTVGAGRGALQGKAAQRGAQATAAEQLETTAAARAAFPEEQAAVRARNEASTSAAKAENVKAKRAYDEAVEREALATQIENERRVAQAAEERTVRGQLAAQENARRLAAAKAEARRPSRDRAIRMLGLDKVRMDKLDRETVAKALYDEVGPGGGSLAEELYAQSPRDAYAAARKLRSDTGAELGRIRKEVAARGGQVEYKVLVERLAEEFGTPKTDVERQAYKAVLNAVKKVGKKTGIVKADDLADLSDEAGELGFAATAGSAAQGRSRALERGAFKRARAVFAKQYKQLVSDTTPTNIPAFDAANAKYGNYKRLEEGTGKLVDEFDANVERQLVKVQKPQRVRPELTKLRRVRPSPVPKPEPVVPALVDEPLPPQFPGGDEAEAAAEALLEGPAGLAPRLATIIARGLGAGVGGKIAGLGGAIAGGRAGGEIARAWFRQVRPSATLLRADADAASAALSQYEPLFAAALERGPRAVAVLHAALRDSDPEYAAVFGDTR